MRDPDAVVLPEFEYDDLFVYAPSYLLWERAGDAVVEGKSIGTAKEHDLVFLKHDRTRHALLHPKKYARERKTGSTIGKRKLKELQAHVEKTLNKLVDRYQAKKIDEDELRTRAVELMKGAWRDCFLWGVRAAGIGGQGPNKPPVKLQPSDEKWLRSAIQHEMRFLNRMLQAVVDETFVMPLPRRIGMYVDALESFYDSARVIGLPAHVAIYWIIPHKDKRVCASCRYLARHSPFSKKTLPTVPRSGATLCLTNCRDRLFVRVVDQPKALELHQSSPTRGEHMKMLRRIKRLGHE